MYWCMFDTKRRGTKNGHFLKGAGLPIVESWATYWWLTSGSLGVNPRAIGGYPRAIGGYPPGHWGLPPGPLGVNPRAIGGEPPGHWG